QKYSTESDHDYVQCDYCGRNFSENAAERHIPYCKEQNSRRGVSSTIKPLTSHRKQAPTRHEERTETTYSRAESRGRKDTRKQDNDSAAFRRSSIESRSASRAMQSTSRSITQSAGIRQPERYNKTPTKRSNSAPKTPASRLKTPVSLVSRAKK
ncbi:hypothetical protein OSTOST_01604, partial [Ostertagia ostertagi]